MIRVLTGAQALVSRMAGVRRLGRDIEGRLSAAQGDLAGRLDALLAAIAEHGRLADERASVIEERLDRLDRALSGQGGTATERDETIQNQLSDLRDRTETALSRAYRHGAAQAAGDVRAELMALRADLAREAEEREGPAPVQGRAPGGEAA